MLNKLWKAMVNGTGIRFSATEVINFSDTVEGQNFLEFLETAAAQEYLVSSYPEAVNFKGTISFLNHGGYYVCYLGFDNEEVQVTGHTAHAAADNAVVVLKLRARMGLSEAV